MSEDRFAHLPPALRERLRAKAAALAAKNRVPASYAQQRLWVLHRLEPDSAAYHMPALLEVDGSLDAEALQSAVDGLVSRHEVLRTRLVEDDEGLRQEVMPARVVRVERFDVSAEAADAHAREWMARPFALGDGDVLRVALYELDGAQRLAFCMHHIASDGVSMGVLVSEIGALYEAAAKGITLALPELPVQYADYARWQREWMDGGELERQLDYWREQLAGVEALAVPTDFSRPAVADSAAGSVPVPVSPSLHERIEAFAREQKTTPYAVWLSLFAALLGRLGRQEDVTIGSPVANRRDAQLEGLIGMFVNTVVQRIDVRGEQSLTELVAHTHEVALRSQEHQDAPFEQVVNACDVQRDLTSTPLFQAMFAYQSQATAQSPVQGLGGISLRNLPVTPTAKFDLSFSLDPASGGSFTYRSSLFTRETVEGWARRLLALAEGALAAPEQPVGSVSILLPGEREQVLQSFQAAPHSEAPGDVVALFRARVRERGSAPALRCENEELSYEALDARSDAIAAGLQQRGLGVGALVALRMDRSLELFEGLLGVWKAGAAYLPLEPSLPEERLAFMLADGGADAELSVEDVRKLRATDGTLSEVHCPPSAPAYLLYTSGTTGRPKGVSVSRGALATYAANARSRFPMDGESLLHGTLAFDATLSSFLPVWLEGGCVTLAPTGPGMVPLESSLDARRFDLVKATPTHFAALDMTRRGQGGTWLLGGERLDASLVQDAHVHNEYGPTECTVGCTSWDSRSGGAASIGTPFPSCGVYVLDAEQRPCGVGMSGELFVAGDQLAQGYHGRPSLTGEKFVPNPFGEPGSRMYRTGDLARWTSAGTLDFLGRVDFQVKLRGYRIELGEIESALEEVDGVERAVVVVRDERLVAYVVAPTPLEAGALSAAVSKRLPGYMVPSHFVTLEVLPLTSTGKLDRRTLPDVQVETEEYAAPEGDEENELAALYEELLGVDRVGRADDFFALGGHSLLATRLVAQVGARLGRQLPLRAVFESPRLRDLAVHLGGEAEIPTLMRASRDGRLPASYAQQRLWVLHRLKPDSAAYHMPALLAVDGTLDVAVLQSAVDGLVARHEVLRTRLVEDTEGLRQEVMPTRRLLVERFEMSADAADTHAREWMSRPFVLGDGDVLRIALYELEDGAQRLGFCMHHIASDGVSMGVLVSEVGALYDAAAKGRPLALPELPVQYADYARWQRGWMEGGELERQLDYWREQLAGVEALAVPTDFGRPAVANSAAGSVPVPVSPSLHERVEAFAREQQTTPYAVWLSLYAALLGRLGRQEDVTIGSPVANRRDAQLEGLIGMFVNTVVQRIDVRGAQSLTELVAHTHEVALRSQEHQDAPFEQVVKACDVPRDLTSTPLFQAMFAYQSQTNARSPVQGLGGISLVSLPVTPTAKFDLSFSLDPASGGSFTYRSSLFTQETVEGWARRLLALAEGALAAPEQPVGSVSILLPGEREQVLQSFQAAPHSEAPGDVVALFRARVRERGSAPALRCENEELSYEALDARSDAIAAGLQQRGLGVGALVALRMDRSLELFEGLLGVWKAGAAYLPLEPSLPEERLAFMLADGGADAELSVEDVRKLRATDGTLSEVHCPPSAPAYLLYTSGTTGRPKGVSVSRGALATYAANARSRFPMGGESLLHGTLAFDATLSSFLPVWLEGGCVTLAPTGPGMVPLESSLDARRFDLVKATPTHFAALDTARRGQGVTWLLGGERLDASLVQDAHVHNQYGPTECTVGCTSWDSRSGGAVSIGTPFSSCGVYVLDEEQRPCGVGMSGELFVAGDQLAQGYHGRPSLTGEKFVPNPFGEPGSRMYRTGDLARWTSAGTLEFLGRVDFQVKLRGYRIELGEIESALEALDGVERAVVVVRDDRLCGYVVSPNAIDSSVLSAALSKRLPGYMVPAHFVALDSLPVTSTGKLDRRALPDVEVETAEYAAPEGDEEKALAALYEELLGIERVGRDDDFFALGGHSLLATRLVALVNARLERELPLRAVFESPRLRELAVHVGGDARLPTLARVSRDGRLPASYAQQRLWVLHRLEPDSTAYHMPALLEVGGRLDGEALQEAVDGLVARHEVLRTRLVEDTEGLRQEVTPTRRVLVERFEMSADAADTHAREWMSRPFVVGDGDVLRIALYELEDGAQRLGFCMHHIASDGVSMGVLVSEVGALYEAAVKGVTLALPELPVQYADYARWQREWMDGGELERQLAYWTSRLAGVEALSLPRDLPRGIGAESDAGSVTVRLDGALRARLEAFALQAKTTPYVVWLTLYAFLLGRIANQADVTVGSPVANRRDAKLEGLIGMFVNTVVQRIDLSSSSTFLGLVAHVHEIALSAQEHQDAPFERVVDACRVTRDLSTTPLFQAMLSYQEASSGASEGAELFEALPTSPSAQFDLTFVVSSAGDGTFVYRSSHFAPESVESWARRFERLADELLREPDTDLTGRAWVGPSEVDALLQLGQGAELTDDVDVIAGFGASVARAPESLALRSGSDARTYQELDEISDRIAAGLQARGVGVGDTVGLCMPRGLALYESVLAVWKAGAAYVPLDPSLPETRLSWIRESSSMALEIDPTSVDELRGCGAAFEPRAVTSDTPAYVLFTSGTTGRPKGVLVSRGALSAYTANARGRFPTTGTSLLMSTLSFDGTLASFVPFWLSGGCVLLAAEGPGLEPMLEVLGSERCDLVSGTPSHLAGVPQELRSQVSAWLVGGEVLSDELASTARVFNEYGPTEATVGCFSWDGASGRSVSLGTAYAGVRAYVMTDERSLCPRGDVGELFVAGPQLAHGYLGRPRLSAEAFLPDPFGPPGSRMYRTGDLARWRLDGDLQFEGRADRQVKVRGHRIELAEIEGALEKQGAVSEARVVVIKEQLHAYIVVEGDELDPSALRVALSEELPGYMVPTTFTRIDAVPLTPAGKLDVRALPAPVHEQGGFEAPIGEVEETLAAIFAELLGIERVGRDDDFFLLGGHSLLATRLVAQTRARLGRQLPLRAVFESPRLRDLAVAVGELSDIPVLSRVSREGRLFASYAQQRLWVLHRLEPDSAAYHMPALLEVGGRLEREALQSAVDGLVARHEVLRTRLVEDTEGLRQAVMPTRLVRVDRFEMSADAAEAHARGWMARPFVLGDGDVLRVAIYELEDGAQRLAFCMHHIASDGVSMGVLVSEIVALYEAAAKGVTLELPELPVQYADYARWQREWMGGGELERQLDYWREQLAGVEALAVPTDFGRPAVADSAAGSVPVPVSPSLHERVEAFAREQQTTPYAVWLSLYAALLGRLGRQEDVTIGSPVANRRDAQLEGLIGMFVNTVVQRIDVRGAQSLTELVAHTHEVALRSQEHQDAPFEQVVKACDVPRDLTSTPLFQAMFAYQSQTNARSPVQGLGGISLVSLPVTPTAKFDLSFSLDPASGGSFTYRSSLFTQETVEGWARRLLALAEGALAAPEQPVGSVSILLPGEREQVLQSFQAAPHSEAPGDVVALFRARVRERGSAPALRCENEELSYEALDARSDAIAAGLQQRGLGVGALVALRMDRSLELFEGLLGVWKAGAAYLPLEPSLPEERLAFMLADGGADAELSVEDVRKLRATDGTLSEVHCPPSAPAYLLYTSGTTGRPKGVSVSRGALATYAANARSRFPMGGESLLHGTLAFDATLSSFLPVWLEGGCVTLAPTGPGMVPLESSLDARRFDLVKATPTHFAALDTARRGQGVTWLLGGERLDASLVQDAHVHNQYGPTECTVGCTSWDSRSGRAASIGTPFPSCGVYVLDEEQRPCGVGMSGELFVAGDQLAQGYHRRPSLTGEKFVPNPFGEPGSRMYRTGDLARWTSAGTLEFLGRVDFQVKLRGYRIELGEIESALEALDGVERAVVVVRDDRLCGYVVSPNAIDSSVLSAALSKRLPGYMVPAHFVALDSLPVTSTGKLDRRALPDVQVETEEYAAPEGDEEKALAALYEELLGIERVGRDDDFFALGGHSLLATRLVALVNARLERELPLRAVFESPRLRELAVHVGGDARLPTLARVSRDGRLPASYAQQRLWVLHRLEPDSTAYHMPALLEVGGRLDGEALQEAVDGLVTRHEVLRTRLVEDTEGLRQEVTPTRRVLVERFEMSADAADTHAREWMSRPFALGDGDVLRIALYELEDGAQRLGFCMHHIASDGVSMRVLVSEVGALYEAAAKGVTLELPELPVQYADYARWQREWMDGGELERQLAYWTSRLAGVEALSLPRDLPRGIGADSDAGSVTVRLDGALRARLEAFARQAKTTPYVVWLTLYAFLLGRIANQADVTVGSPVANRRDAKLEGLIGMFVNTVVQRIDLSSSSTFSGLVAHVHEIALSTQEHQDAPFERVVDACRVTRDLSTTPLFQAMLSYQEASSGASEGAKLFEALPTSPSAQFDLTFVVSSAGDGTFVYRSSHFAPESVESWARRFERLADELLREPDTDLTGRAWVDPSEVDALLQLGQGAELTDDVDVIAGFGASVARAPESLALRSGSDARTYQELDEISDRIAAGLQARGVGVGDTVGLCMPRGLALYESVLAVWKAGAAYVPLDPSLPETRLSWIRESSSMALEIDPTSVDELRGCGAAFEPRAVTSDTPAYVLFTSGTTGRPKGVLVSRGALSAYTANARGRFPTTGTSLLMSTLSFDGTLASFVPFWLSGGCVLLAAEGPGLEPMLEVLGSERCDLVSGTPSHLAGVPQELRSQVSAWLVGGEVLSDELASTARVFNEYGPTEATVGCFSWDGASGRSVSLGTAYAGVRAYVMTDERSLCPRGDVGELFVAGPQLAHGYLGRPRLSAEAFLPDPFGPPGSRMYRTGDLARWRLDGDLQFEGRADRQVKVRGHRIELAEIEGALEKQGAVSEARVVVIKEQLHAYIVVEGDELDPSALRVALSEELPGYMVPTTFTRIDAVPLTPAGKLDVRALPAPVHEQGGFEAPSGEVEETLAAIFAELLGIERVGRDDDFFSLGGHSLLATRLSARVASEFDLAIPLGQFFVHSTVRDLAEALQNARCVPSFSTHDPDAVIRSILIDAGMTVEEVSDLSADELHELAQELADE